MPACLPAWLHMGLLPWRFQVLPMLLCLLGTGRLPRGRCVRLWPIACLLPPLRLLPVRHKPTQLRRKVPKVVPPPVGGAPRGQGQAHALGKDCKGK